MIANDNLLFIVLFAGGILLVLLAGALLLLGQGRQVAAAKPKDVEWRHKAAAFERGVRAYFVREGWTLTANRWVDFNAARGIVRLSVLVGPHIFDPQCIGLQSILSEKVYNIRDSYIRSASTHVPNILVVVESSSLPFFREVEYPHTSVIPIDRIDYINHLGKFALDDRDEGESWALSASKMNSELCRQLSKNAAQAGNAALARSWAECAADAGPTNALAQHDVAGFRLKAGELDAAAVAAARAVWLAPANLSFRRRLSTIEVERGNLLDAIVHAKTVAAAGTPLPADHHYLAGLYIRASQWDLAEEAQQKALAMQPDNVPFQRRLADLRRKREQCGAADPS